jgi:prevent-host-death family protein
MEMSVRELRAHLNDALRAAESGDEVVVTRRGRAVVRLVAASVKPRGLPSFAALRASIRWKGKESPIEFFLRERHSDRI